MPLPKNKVDCMAEVLAETVAELGSNVDCRRALGFAGWSDREINQYLGQARAIARRLRVAEIDRLYKAQFNPKSLKHG